MSFTFGRFLFGRARYSAGMQTGSVADAAVAEGTRTAALKYAAVVSHAAAEDMAPAVFLGAGHIVISNSSTGASIGLPPGLVAGDYVVLAQVSQSEPTPPDGYDTLATVMDTDFAMRLDVYGRRLQTDAEAIRSIHIAQTDAKVLQGQTFALRGRGWPRFVQQAQETVWKGTHNYVDTPEITPEAVGIALAVACYSKTSTGGAGFSVSEGWVNASPGDVWEKRLAAAAMSLLSLDPVSCRFTSDAIPEGTTGNWRAVTLAADVVEQFVTRNAAHAVVATASQVIRSYVLHTGAVADTAISAGLHRGVEVELGLVDDVALSAGRRAGGALYRAALADIVASADGIMGRLMWENNPSPADADWQPEAPPADNWTPQPANAGSWSPQQNTTDIWTPQPVNAGEWNPTH